MNTEPVPIPLLTSILVDAIHAENQEEGKRPKAFDTLFRHSDAGKCARQIAFGSLGYAETEPMDLSGEWVTWIGKTVHDFFQRALLKVYPDAEVEVKVRFDISSGHLDALVTIDGITICYELKTRGSYGFDQATGLMRKNWSRKEPQGPRISDILQGSLNAVASNADLLIVGIISLEAMSKGYAEKMGVSDLDRFMAEWHYSRDEFEPMARGELERLEEVKAWLDRETLPPRWGVDEAGRSTEFNPDKDNFPCGYCSFKTMCQFAGHAPVALPIPGLREFLKEDARATY